MTRETETRHSANEVRETGGSSFTQWCLDHAVGVSHENRETEVSRTTQWHSIPESFLGVSRPSCGELPQWHRTSDYAVAKYYTAVLE